MDAEQNEPPSINRLVMIKANECMLCKKNYEYILCTFEITYREGWVYCSECLQNNTLKNKVMEYIEYHKIIPFGWIHNIDAKVSDEKVLNFYRYSRRNTNPIHKAIFNYETRLNGTNMYYIENSLRMNVNFKDNATDVVYTRTISLQNLFKHNINLYNDLTNCDNLFASILKISYDELPLAIKNCIEDTYVLSQSDDYMSFLADFERSR
jgi:hypothetical protein